MLQPSLTGLRRHCGRFPASELAGYFHRVSTRPSVDRGRSVVIFGRRPTAGGNRQLTTLNFRHPGSGESVEVAPSTDRAVNHYHADAGQVAALNAVQNGFTRGVLRLVKEDEGGGAALGNDAAVEVADLRSVSGSKTDSRLRGDVSQSGEHGNHSQNAERLNAGAGGRIGAQNHAVKLFEFAGGKQGQQGCLFIAVVNNLQGAG